MADIAPYGACDRIKYRGFGNQERIIRISKGSLGGRLRPGSGYTVKTTGQLFERFSPTREALNPRLQK